MNRLTNLKKGFTLIEMLIAVLIFVALVSIAFITLSRSAASTEKADELRGKTEAARQVIDQLTNDFQYLYLDGNFIYPSSNPNQNISIKGFGVLADPASAGYKVEDYPLMLVMKYPNSDSFVLKRYDFVDLLNGSYSGYQGLGNTIKTSEIELTSDDYELKKNGNFLIKFNAIRKVADFISADPSNSIFSNAYQANYRDCYVNKGNVNDPVYDRKVDDLDWCTFFYFKTIDEGRSSAKDSWSNGYLKVQVVIKSANLNADEECAKQNPGTCYKLETTLVPRLTK